MLFGAWKAASAFLVVLALLTSAAYVANIGDEYVAEDVTELESASDYTVVDTDQTMYYDDSASIPEPAGEDAYSGQDAAYEGITPSYLDNGDGTVTDLNTGLMWQQDPGEKMTFEEAVEDAGSFELAGYGDWRLPNIKELYSLILFSGTDPSGPESSDAVPFIDIDYFDFEYGDESAGERMIDAQYWSSTEYVSTTMNNDDTAFGVNFADGRIKGYPTENGPGGEPKENYVLYVRGSTDYGENDYSDNGDGTVTDEATGLMWMKYDSGYGMDWEIALEYAEDRTYAGYDDWRLPNAKELQSIVDYSRSPDTSGSAAIDPVFDCTEITNEGDEADYPYYWTGTTHAQANGGGSFAVYIAFGRGLGYMETPDGNTVLMDVHGAGCQRSDPKSGDAGDWEDGNGPQGDVVRIDNYVRLVRTVDDSDVEDSGDTAVDEGSASDDAPVPEGASSTNSAYILFATLQGTQAYLIDLDGGLVHDWELSGKPGNSVYLTEEGNLLATYGVRGSFSADGNGGGVELLTWDGEQIWSYELASETAQLHHDVDMLPNGNVLMIALELITTDEALEAGLTEEQLPDSGEFWADMILEYDPALDEIVWEWHMIDHVLENDQTASEHPEKIDLEYVANTASEDWFHSNAVDYNIELDQIVISLLGTSEIWIIDHNLSSREAAGTDGDLLYRFGNPSAYGGEGDQITIGQHDAEWLDNGNILLFDNGDQRNRPYSRVLEIELPDYSDGSFGEACIVWEYGAGSGEDHFFSHRISGSQRLDGGNTLICVGSEGRFMEVAPEGQIIWDYVSTYTITNREGEEVNDVFRCERYEASYSGFEGTEVDALADKVEEPDKDLPGDGQVSGEAPVDDQPAHQGPNRGHVLDERPPERSGDNERQLDQERPPLIGGQDRGQNDQAPPGEDGQTPSPGPGSDEHVPRPPRRNSDDERLMPQPTSDGGSGALQP